MDDKFRGNSEKSITLENFYGWDIAVTTYDMNFSLSFRKEPVI